MAKDKFEDHLAELEEAIRQLEGGELGLEESLGKYESGVKALQKCREILETAEKKIEELVKNKDGSLSTRPLETASAEAGAGAAAAPKAKKARKAGDDDGPAMF